MNKPRINQLCQKLDKINRPFAFMEYQLTVRRKRCWCILIAIPLIILFISYALILF